MIFSIVDVNVKNLDTIKRNLLQLHDQAQVMLYSDPEAALAAVDRIKPDWFITEVELGNRDGIALARRVKKKCPSVRIGIMNDSNEYMQSAWKMHAKCYLLKPVTKAMLDAEIFAEER